MNENNWIEQAVQKVVAEVLQSQIPQLQSSLVQRVLQAVGPQSAPAPAPEASPAGLLKAISAIQAGSAQREILRALLDYAARYSGRAALFVIKSGVATGWQGRGFSNPDDIKDFPLDVASGIAGRALQSRITFPGSAAEMDPKFIAHFGAPHDGHALLLPLLLKERVAALVYADAGAEPGAQLDAAAMELLVVAASAWLEVAASRKQGHKEGAGEPSAPQRVEKSHAAAAAASSSSALHDPFASHAPQHGMPPVGITEEYPATATATAIAEPESAPTEPAEAAPPAAETPADMSAEDAETHRKAQRFARLLVDEIKLYNQAKVTEGRKNKDVYDRLKDDIDKSLATYQKRYGATVAASADYFNHEIIRSLAEEDASAMGANFSALASTAH